MNLEDELSSLMEFIPKSKDCCFCLSIRSGTKLIALFGIILGLTCGVMLLLKDRKYLTISTIILISLLSIFIVVTIMFVVNSVMLLIAVCDENADIMTCYIWLACIYLCVQLVLAIAIPIVLAIEGRYPLVISLMWLVAVMIITLAWTHFISVVNTYRLAIIYGED